MMKNKSIQYSIVKRQNKSICKVIQVVHLSKSIWSAINVFKYKFQTLNKIGSSGARLNELRLVDGPYFYFIAYPRFVSL